MATTLLLVRHGETEWNTLGKFQGCTDIPLSDEGLVQAHFLRKRLENSFDFIYSSPLNRALSTANTICTNMKIPPQVEQSLREINFGEWEGLTIKEIKKLYPEKFSMWVTDSTNAPIPSNDISIRLASIRAKEAILKIIDEHKDKTIVIVSHGGIIKAALIGLFNWDMTMYHKITLGNTAICKIVFNDSLIPKIITLNDTSHFPENYDSRSLT